MCVKYLYLVDSSLISVIADIAQRSLQPPDVTSNTAQSDTHHAHAQSVRLSAGMSSVDFTQGGTLLFWLPTVVAIICALIYLMLMTRCRSQARQGVSQDSAVTQYTQGNDTFAQFVNLKRLRHTCKAYLSVYLYCSDPSARHSGNILWMKMKSWKVWLWLTDC